jgi:hypothetical protein
MNRPKDTVAVARDGMYVVLGASGNTGSIIANFLLSGVLAAQELRSPENSTPTSFEKFVQDVFAAAYNGQATTA